MIEIEANRALAARFWTTLYERDWDAVAAFFGPGSEYTDVPSPPDDVAHGPEEIVARLRLGLEPLATIGHTVRRVVADADAVVTEHDEHWSWATGESVTLPFVSVQEISGDRVTRWWDYWDLQTLMGAAPAWWLEHIRGCRMNRGWGAARGGCGRAAVPLRRGWFARA